MAYNHDVVTAGTLLAQIETRLGAAWTQHDATSKVYKTTTDDGKEIFLQLSEAAGEYIQLEGWHSWNEVTHVGTTGSGTTYQRIYYATSPVASGITVDLYISITGNRVWLVIDCPTGALRGWGYFGGIITNVADQTAVVLGSNHMDNHKMIMWHTDQQSLAWGVQRNGVVIPLTSGSAAGILETTDGVIQYNPHIWDSSRYHMWRTFCLDSPTAANYLTGANAECRGLMDGVRLVARAGLANFDTLVEDGIDNLVVFPISKSTADCFFCTSTAFGLAFEEV